MPKIKAEYFKIAGTDHMVNIWYSEKDGFHVRGGLPEDMKSIVNMETIINTNRSSHYNKYDTIDKLKAALHEAIKAYEDQKKSKRKVIYVSLSVGTKTLKHMGKDGPRELSRHYFSDEGFTLNWSIGFEYIVGKETRYTALEPDPFADPPNSSMGEKKTHVGEGTAVIEWTEEREVFFKRTSDSIAQMCSKLMEFFNSDPLLLAQKIDNTRLLFAAPDNTAEPILKQ